MKGAFKAVAFAQLEKKTFFFENLESILMKRNAQKLKKRAIHGPTLLAMAKSYLGVTL